MKSSITVDQLSHYLDQEVVIQGWVYRTRSSKHLLFIEVRDGSGIVQSILTEHDVSEEVWRKGESLRQESSVCITGVVKRDERSEKGVEVHISGIDIIQIAEDYPISHKEHGVEFLMENRHLWLRSQRQWAIMRVRHTIINAIHQFFDEQGFIHMDAPIFTGNAAEGTTTLFETDYFDEKAYLTQSGQLYGEAMAMAHGKIYTFGPTFRAEKSKTRRHLTEFWMIEPEMAFYDLNMNMDLAESFLKYVIKKTLEERNSELNQLGRDLSKLEKIVENPFIRISYTDAVEKLTSAETQGLLEKMNTQRSLRKVDLEAEVETLKKEAGNAKKWRKTQIDSTMREIHAELDQIEEDLRNIPVWKKSAAEFQWGNDFGGSDETILTMQFDAPLIVHRYPAEVKAFYMKRDPENDKLALAMDVLAPEGYGEIIGGSQREDDLEMMRNRIAEHDLPESIFSWYLDLRKYGTVPHSGFGLGLERTVAWICGLSHLRETIPFPRMMGRLSP